MKPWLTIRRLLWLALVAGWVGLAVPQEGTGSIEGHVFNAESGDGIGGVTVRIVQTPMVTVTDDEGRFVLKGLAAGSYTLMLSYRDDTRPRIVAVTDGQASKVEIETDWVPGVYEKVTVRAIEEMGKIVDAPAAVTEIPEEEIEQEASHGQLPKVLEYTPGAEVTQSGLYDFNFNTRGFNSSLNRRVSTYIDGRDVGVPLLGAQEWSALSIPLEDLASVEFIRGPSAALYGANASSGVIKMTTKSPRDSQGGVIRVTGGELNTLSTDFRWANGLGKGWYFKVVGGTRDTGDFTVSRDPCGPGVASINCTPPYPPPPPPEYSRFCTSLNDVAAGNCLPTEKTLVREDNNVIRFGTVRLDKYLTDDSLITLETGTTSVKGPVFQTGIGRVQALDVSRPWARFAYSHPRFNALAHWANRTGEQINLNRSLDRGQAGGIGQCREASTPGLLQRRDNELCSDTVRYGAELQGNWNLAGGKGRFVIGGGYTHERIDTPDPDGGQTVLYQPIDNDREAVFSQFDWEFNEHVKFVGAGRVDWNDLHATQFSPKAAIVYSINPNHSLRFTYNEAFQVANFSEFFLHARLAASIPTLGVARNLCYASGLDDPLNPPAVNCAGITDNSPVLAVGNSKLDLEKTSAWEVGYSAILGKKAFLSVDYYNSRNKDFITDLIPPRTTEGVPFNQDYPAWVGPPPTETTEAFPFLDPDDVPGTTPDDVSVAQAIRNNVFALTKPADCVPPNANQPHCFTGAYLGRDPDGFPVVIARTYTNVGKVDTQGVDLGLQVFLTQKWHLQTSYSWFDFHIKSSGANEQQLLPNSPEHKASMVLSYGVKRWSASIAGRWVDGFPWAAGIFQGEVPDYYTTDLTVNWSFDKRFGIGLNVANLTDNVHRETFGGDLLERRGLLNTSYRW